MGYEKFKFEDPTIEKTYSPDTPGDPRETMVLFSDLVSGKQFNSVVGSGGGTGGGTGGGDDDDDDSPDFSDGVKSGFGDLQIQKNLIDANLQNIFNMYEQNIQNLSQKEQKDVQDAYYIKEMSKKYLGEYASNLGINDVSGNLIDIYGKYQSNLQDINEHYSELEFGLQQEYNQARFEKLQERMIVDYQIDVAEFNEYTQNLLYNLTSGNFEGDNPFEYLEGERENIGDSAYRMIHSALYNQTLDEITANIDNNNFGYTVDEEGNRTPIESGEEYLAQYKDILNPTDYSILQGAVRSSGVIQEVAMGMLEGDYGDYDNAFDFLDSYKDVIGLEEYAMYYEKAKNDAFEDINYRMSLANETGYYGYIGEGEDRRPMTQEDFLTYLEENYDEHLSGDKRYTNYKETVEMADDVAKDNQPSEWVSARDQQYINPETGEYEENPYYEEDLDMTAYDLWGVEDGIDSDSQVIVEKESGNKFIVVDNNVDNDEEGREKYGSEMPIDSLEVTKSLPEGTETYLGMVVEQNNMYFYRMEDGWHRLVMHKPSDQVAPSQAEMALWRSSNNDTGLIDIDTRGPGKDEMTYNGVTYRAKGSANWDYSDDWEEMPRDLIYLFFNVHGETNENGNKVMKTNAEARVVYYDGDFYLWKRGKIWKMEEK